MALRLGSSPSKVNARSQSIRAFSGAVWEARGGRRSYFPTPSPVLPRQGNSLRFYTSRYRAGVGTPAVHRLLSWSP